MRSFKRLRLRDTEYVSCVYVSSRKDLFWIVVVECKNILLIRIVLQVFKRSTLFENSIPFTKINK